MNIEEYTISQYMNLQETIKRMEQRQKIIRHEFYQQSFHTHTAFNEMGVYVEALRPEKATEILIELETAVTTRLERAQVKEKYWRKFLESLPVVDRQYFIDKYRHSHHCLYRPLLEEKAIEEIEEIETAISLRYNEKESYLQEIELVDDPMANITNLLALVE